MVILEGSFREFKESRQREREKEMVTERMRKETMRSYVTSVSRNFPFHLVTCFL